jgi:hypothetical protein
MYHCDEILKLRQRNSTAIQQQAMSRVASLLEELTELDELLKETAKMV